MAALLDIVTKASTDRSVTLRIIDSGDGTPETGVVYNTSGIDLWYRREGGAKVSITEATLADLETAHTDGGFLHIANGEYRLDLPDAAFATGANYVDIGGTVTGMIVIGGRVRLANVNIEDAVRGGLTALPDAAADAAGGLPISDAGGLDLDAMGTKLAALSGYTDGWVYIDATNGVSGTTEGVNGVEDNPSDTFADAYTISAAHGRRIKLLSNVTVTSGTFANCTIDLNGYALTAALAVTWSSPNMFSSAGRGELNPYIFGGESRVKLFIGRYNNLRIYQPSVDTDDYPYLSYCELVNSIIADSGSTDPFQAVGCYFTTTGGAAAFELDCTNGVAFHLYNCWGDLLISNLSAGQSVNYPGWAQVTIDDSCDGGTLYYSSHIEVTDESGGAVTLVPVSSSPSDESIADAVWDEATAGHVGAGTFGTTAANLTSVKAVTDLLAASAGTIVGGTVDTVANSHTPTTTVFQADDITEATADHFNGRIVIFTSGALANQATDITDYEAVGGIGQFTVTAMTEAPANNDTFIII